MVFIGVIMYLCIILFGISLKRNAQKNSAAISVDSLPKVREDPTINNIMLRCTHMQNYTAYSGILYCNEVPIDIKYPQAM